MKKSRFVHGGARARAGERHPSRFSRARAFRGARGSRLTQSRHRGGAFKYAGVLPRAREHGPRIALCVGGFPPPPRESAFHDRAPGRTRSYRVLIMLGFYQRRSSRALAVAPSSDKWQNEHAAAVRRSALPQHTYTVNRSTDLILLLCAKRSWENCRDTRFSSRTRDARRHCRELSAASERASEWRFV